MAVTEKLNTAWNTKEAMDAVFEVRAKLQNLANVASETKAEVDAITAGASFASVDAEIKQEGAALIVIVNALNNALASHQDFLTWTQPEA